MNKKIIYGIIILVLVGFIPLQWFAQAGEILPPIGVQDITTSRGTVYPPEGKYVQEAIDEVYRSGGGEVWVNCDIEITQPIYLKEDVYVDFMNHEIRLRNDISCVILTGGVKYATFKNVRIWVTSSHTASVILLHVPSSGGWDVRVRYNLFDNIRIRNPSHWTSGVGWDGHYYTGIHLLNEGSSNMLDNNFRNIWMEGAGTGILLENPQYSGWSNGNTFENIWIDQFVTCIWFKLASDAHWGFNQNLFRDVKAQSARFSKWGVRDISHNGNHFDHVLLWDWHVASAPIHEWTLTSKAYKTVICAHYIHDIVDNGRDTTVGCIGEPYDLGDRYNDRILMDTINYAKAIIVSIIIGVFLIYIYMRKKIRKTA